MYLSCSDELLQEVIDAKEKEFNSLKPNDVFEEVESSGQKAISTKRLLQKNLRITKDLLKLDL